MLMFPTSSRTFWRWSCRQPSSKFIVLGNYGIRKRVKYIMAKTDSLTSSQVKYNHLRDLTDFTWGLTCLEWSKQCLRESPFSAFSAEICPLPSDNFLFKCILNLIIIKSSRPRVELLSHNFFCLSSDPRELRSDLISLRTTEFTNSWGTWCCFS